MISLKTPVAPGDVVILDGELPARVEAVIWRDGAHGPLIEVSWWNERVQEFATVVPSRLARRQTKGKGPYEQGIHR